MLAFIIGASVKRDLKKKLDEMTFDDLSRWASWTIAGGAIVLSASFGTYAMFFKEHFIGTDPSAWGAFGDFIGGVSNPILSFLTIALLAITIILQSRQLQVSSTELKLSREELELTRAELTRSAAAQELSERALRAQAAASDLTARLAAINALMAHYQKELQRHHGLNYPATDPRHLEVRGLRRRYGILEQRLEQFYVELTGAEDE